MPDFLIPGTESIPLKIQPIKEGEQIFSFCLIDSGDLYLEDFIIQLDEYLPGVVLPKKVIENHQTKVRAGLTSESILEKARGFLQKTTRENINSSGELGQVLLHLFAEKVLNANKLVSKFYKRETLLNPYRGLDSLYMQQDESGNIYMLAGEAKVYQDPNVGLRKAHSDLSDFWQKEHVVDFEISIAADAIRDGLSDDNMEMYESYFIKDNENHQNLKFKNIILVGYNSDGFARLISKANTQEEFHSLVHEELDRCFNNQRGIIEACDKCSIYCFIPLEAIDNARQLFSEHNGLFY